MKYLIAVIILSSFGTLSSQTILESNISKSIIIENKKNSIVFEKERGLGLKVDSLNYLYDELYHLPFGPYTYNANNPLSWDLDSSTIFFIKRQFLMQNAFSITIGKTPLQLLIPYKKDTDVVNLYNLKKSASDAFYIEMTHQRKFNVKDLENLYYDFVLTEREDIAFVSYFSKEICVYSNKSNSFVASICGCSEIDVSPPFNLIVGDTELFLLDNKSSLYSISLVDGSNILINNNSDFLKRNTEFKLRTSDKQSIDPATFTIIK